MRVTNDIHDMLSGPATELLKLQADFQAKLAEETLRYLRRLQNSLTPAAPGTVFVTEPESVLAATGRPGSRVRLELQVENRQAVHCILTPMLSTLVDDRGTTWFPEVEYDPESALIAPGEHTELSTVIELPRALPAATFRGTLLLIGFRSRGVPVAIDVEGGPAGEKKPQKEKPDGAEGEAGRADAGNAASES